MSEVFTSIGLLCLAVAVFSMLMSARAHRRSTAELARVVGLLAARDAIRTLEALGEKNGAHNE